MPSLQELEATSRAAEQELVSYAASMSERRTAQWTLEERGRLHQLSEAARKARLELDRATRPVDQND